MSLFFDEQKWQYITFLEDSFFNLRKEFDKFPANRYDTSDKHYSHMLIRSNLWFHLPFITKGKYHWNNIEDFPTVNLLLKQIPIFDNCLFSILKPNAYIPSHKGHSDMHLRVHLGIYTDGKAWIRIGDQIRHWMNGKCLIFKDIEEHEVYNPSDVDRVIFLFDIKKEDYANNLNK